MNTLELLKKARARIATPDKWYQGYYRDGVDKDTAGINLRPVELPGAKGPDDCRVCALGALYWAAHGDPLPPLHQTPEVTRGRRILEDHVQLVAPGRGLGRWQDQTNRTHKEVLALYDRTIEELEGPE